jgi:hypothetical protein
MASQTDLKNQINLYDSLIIIFLALLTNVISELLSWIFIYRKKKYKECKKQIDALNKKIEISKESIKGKAKSMDKKVKQQEGDLKVLNMEMMKVKKEIKYLDQNDYHFCRWTFCRIFLKSL